jgi:small-conductance mechanosensitive channel
MPTSPDALRLLNEAWQDLQQARVLWQLAVFAASLLAAWLAARVLRPRFAAADGRPAFGREVLSQLLFPLGALVLVLIGRAVLRQWQPTGMLNVAVPLLTSFALVRFAVLMLRQVFAPSGWLDTLSRLIAWAIWLGFALHVTGLAPELLSFLDDIGFKVGKQRISLLLILQGALSVLVTLLVSLWLARFAEARLMGAAGLDISLRVMLSKLAQALLVLAAFLIALPAVGIDLTVLSVFGGMLGVGIGFGLQKIASNYVSGFLILLDRSVSIGDLVTVDQHTGQLTKMTARYVVVRSLGGVEAIIPNETIITSTVVNHSYSDRRVRVPIAVQVSYRSDLDLALRLMEAAARAHPRVLRDPAPRVLILGFADSGISLELGVWIEDPQEGTGNLRSDLNHAVWRAFREHGIDIPYPQREVRLLGQPAPPDPAVTNKSL